MIFSALKRFSKPRESEEITRAFARCFNTKDGKTVLEYLHTHTLFRITDPLLSDDQLRFIEGQRQLVLFICQTISKSKP
jgi:hypothetical protein